MARAKSMRLPVEIVLFGYKIGVDYYPGLQDDDGTRLRGDCAPAERDDRRIRISYDEHDRSVILSTLKHELVHMSLGLSGVADVLASDPHEEGVCMACENGLLSLLDFQQKSPNIKWATVKLDGTIQKYKAK